MIEFPHTAPEGYSYEFETFKRNVISIWVLNHSISFSYTDKTPRSIWGFYDSKKKLYYAPVNSTKQGKEVRIENTTPYSAMQLNLTPLEAAFSK